MTLPPPPSCCRCGHEFRPGEFVYHAVHPNSGYLLCGACVKPRAKPKHGRRLCDLVVDVLLVLTFAAVLAVWLLGSR